MKYLIEIHHGIGDIVQITGLIETIKQYEPESEIGVIVNSKVNAALFSADKRVDKLFILNIHTMSVKQILAVLKDIRKQRYDQAFLSPISNRRDAQILAVLMGARKTYGEQLSVVSKLSRRYVCVPREDSHIVERNNNLLKATNLFPTIASPKMCVPYEELEAELEVLKKPLIGICIGTSKPVKTWPVKKYLYVAEKLEQYHIVFIGGPDEAKMMPKELWHHHPNWHNCLGKVSMLGSAALMKHCDVVLGGDTGAMHMAAAVGCATVTLFSCSDPKYHAPYSDKSFVITKHLECQYCYAYGGYETCSQYKCIDLISEDEVLKMMEKVIDETVK